MTDRTEGSDSGLSSEELIRQARMPYEAPTDASETAVAPEPPYSPPATAEPPPAARFEPPPQQIHRPADGIGGQYADAPLPPASWDGTAPTPPQRSLFQRYGKLAVFAIIGLGVILYGVLDKTKDVEDLAVGDCLLMPETEEISSVETIDCASGHELEVFALIKVPDGRDAPYPGEDTLADTIFEECLLRFQPYVGTNYEDSVWFANPLYPTQESWEESNDREGSCVLLQIGPDQQARTVMGSARGSGR